MVRPAPVFNHVDATGTQQWEEKFEGYPCFLIGVRRIVHHQVKLIRQLTEKI